MSQPVSSAVIRRTLQRKCALTGIPVSGTFELTPRCNLSCKMCYVRLTPAEMQSIGREKTAEEWIAFAEEARNAGMVFLLITGGEPTLRDDFCTLYEAFVKLGLSISINTNGTLLSANLRNLWHRLPPAQVNVTLYGICREDYASLCGNGDAFDRVMETLDWLNSEGILIHLNTTMAPSNKHRWLELENFAKERGLELRMTNYCFPPVRRCASGCEFARLTPEEAAELTVNDLYFREGIDGIRKSLSSLSAPQNPCELDIGEPMRCLAGRSQFWITWDGRMLPCGMLDFPVTRPFDTSFSEAWEMLRAECAKIRLCPDCLNCPDRNHCLNCAAVTYTETGNFAGKPEYMCRMSRAYRRLLEEKASER